MRAGRLKHRVTIQRPAKSRDEYGEEIETFESMAVVWAGIEPVSGTENIHAGQETSLTTYNIIMRYISITPHDRIMYSGRVFTIKSILNFSEIDKQIKILAVENV